ncbi:MAG: phosphate ABC transporter substrate-binding protein [Bacteroidales bacterium]|nr:phosphate ABC transporter substrate-binding protein [Bacteroidales bacterium]
MRKNRVVIVAFLLGFLAHAVQAQRLKGSDTCLPVTQREAEIYMVLHPEAEVAVTGGGSGVGIKALMEGTTDVAMSSRALKFDEKIKFKKAGLTPEEKIVAYDALAVVVHPSNPVTKLTREQLEGIFTGKITNWKEVGGEDKKIIAYARETSSGTYEFFKESVLKNKNYKSSILSMPATGAIIQSVKQTKGAIGYVGLAYLNKAVKPVAVSYDGGGSFVMPTFENALAKCYPIVRPLLYYYSKDADSAVKDFIGFMMSDQGQKVVKETGFIPVR